MDITNNAVIYARYSSDKQTEQSIEGQPRVCYEYAEKCGYNVIGEYIDRAMSGRYDDRPQFLQMLSDSDKRQFQYVLVYKLDRFSRSRYDSAVHKYKLRKNGVRVVSAMEHIGNTPESILLEALLEASAEYYSIDLAQKVKRGMNESALKGNSCGGTVPLGYKIENKKLVIDEISAPIVRYIFKAFADGVGKKELAESLNNKGYRTSQGNLFKMTSFNTILSNKKYIGVYQYADVEIENGCPALIDKAVFEKCQQRLKAAQRTRGAKKATVEYLLNGKAFCGMCGAHLVGESGYGRHGKQYTYYTCSDRKKLHTCKKKNEKKDFLEWYVVEQTVQYILDERRLDYISERVAALYEAEFNDNDVRELEKELSQTESDIISTTEALIKTTAASAIEYINKKLEELENRKADLSIEIAKLKVATSNKITKKHVRAWLKSFCQGDLFDMEFRRRIIDVLVNSVYVYDDKIIILYNVKNGKQVCAIEPADLDDVINGSDGFTNGVPGKRLAIASLFSLALHKSQNISGVKQLLAAFLY